MMNRKASNKGQKYSIRAVVHDQTRVREPGRIKTRKESSDTAIKKKVR